MSMDLNKTYERVISKLIVPKHNFITGIESLNVEKDDTDRISIKITFYLSASWANTMFNSYCRETYIDGERSEILLRMSDINDRVINGFYSEKDQIIKDLETINKLLGYKTNYYTISFGIRFVMDFDN
jgi:hypothetical protein